MDKKDVKNYFDGLAYKWDAMQTRDDEKINFILDCAGVERGLNILDVACGTGILFPYYLARQVKKIVGVDISSEMIKFARNKFNDFSIELINADIEQLDFAEKFDCCMVYNAFPHFPHPQSLVRHLSQALKTGGRLTIAHGLGRDRLNQHHCKYAESVSRGLISAQELGKLYGVDFEVDKMISTEQLYIVTGSKIG